MSTATLEPPAEIKAEPSPLAGAPPTPAERADILRGMFGDKAEAKITPPKAEEKKEEAKAEVVKEAPKETAKEQPKEEAKASDKEENLAALRQKWEASDKLAKEHEAALKAAREEFENFKKNPVPKEVQDKLSAIEKERDEYRQHLRVAALQRDPDFNRKYSVPIESGMKQMVEMLTAAGVEQKDATKAVSGWNEQFFAEVVDGMDSVGKLKFGAAMQRVVELYGQKEAELADADNTWKSIETKRAEDAKKQSDMLKKMLADDAETVLKDLAETDLGKTDAELLNTAKAAIRNAVGLDGEGVPNRELMRLIGSGTMLAKAFERKSAELAEKEAKIAELHKQIEEKDTFIKERAGSVPNVNGSRTGTVSDKEARKAEAKSILMVG